MKVDTPISLSSQVQITQCIHNKKSTVSYIAYHQNGQKMVLKIFNNRILQELRKFQTISQMQKNFINLKIYLKQKYGIQRMCSIPTNILQISYLKTNNKVVYLCRKYIQGHSLNNLISTESNIINNISLQKFIKQQLSIFISFQGFKDYLLTSCNLFIDQYHQISYNWSSFVGIGFIIKEEIIPKYEFYEILPYLNSGIFEKDPLKRTSFNLKIRSLVINLLKLIIKEDFDLINDISINQYIDPKDSKTKNIIRQIPQLCKNFMKKKNVKAHIQNAQVNQTKSNFFKKDFTFKKLFSDILIKQRQFQSYQQFIYQYFFEENIESPQFIKLKNAFQILHQIRFKQQDSIKQQSFKEKGLHTLAFYLPITFRAELKYLMNQKYWFLGLTKTKMITNVLIEKNNNAMEKIAYSVISLLFFINQLKQYKNFLEPWLIKKNNQKKKNNKNKSNLSSISQVSSERQRSFLFKENQESSLKKSRNLQQQQIQKQSIQQISQRSYISISKEKEKYINFQQEQKRLNQQQQSFSQKKEGDQESLKMIYQIGINFIKVTKQKQLIKLDKKEIFNPYLYYMDPIRRLI